MKYLEDVTILFDINDEAGGGGGGAIAALLKQLKKSANLTVP